jgi:hypothetical protein
MTGDVHNISSSLNQNRDPGPALEQEGHGAWLE